MAQHQARVRFDIQHPSRNKYYYCWLFQTGQSATNQVLLAENPCVICTLTGEGARRKLPDDAWDLASAPTQKIRLHGNADGVDIGTEHFVDGG